MIYAEEQAVGECPVAMWNNCYDDSWNGHIVDEAFQHPAKMSYGLVERIIKHGFTQGYWKVGDLCADPFGGVGCVGIMAAAHGLRYVAVEIEARFCALAEKNFQLNPWCRNGACTIIQGDSRNFASLIGQCQGVVTSPPYAETLNSETHGIDFTKSKPDYPGRVMHAARVANQNRHHEERRYGSTPGQLAALPMGEVAAILTSPPYTGNEKSDYRVMDENGLDRDQRRGYRQGEGGFRSSERAYGKTPGQIADLPPDEVSSIVTSPPWEQTGTGADKEQQNRQVITSGIPTHRSGAVIGSTTGETYWQAVADIYRQCFLVLKPGGVMAVVVADFVRKGKLVPLTDDTLKLLVSIGFEPLERVRAMQVKHDDHPGLFEANVRKTTERKSFFRRLAEKKGSPPKDFETVLFVVRPL